MKALPEQAEALELPVPVVVKLPAQAVQLFLDVVPAA
jgi:hypothetical protein